MCSCFYIFLLSSISCLLVFFLFCLQHLICFSCLANCSCLLVFLLGLSSVFSFFFSLLLLLFSFLLLLIITLFFFFFFFFFFFSFSVDHLWEWGPPTTQQPNHVIEWLGSHTYTFGSIPYASRYGSCVGLKFGCVIWWPYVSGHNHVSSRECTQYSEGM